MRLAIVAGLILAVTVAAPVAAQDRLKDKVSVNALMGAGITGDSTRFDMRASAGLKANRWLSLVGEWGTLSKTTFRSAQGPIYSGVSGYHVNGNLVATAPKTLHVVPYATFGLGTFVTSPGPLSERRRADFAMNAGGGVSYDISRWLGVTADYRRFVVDYGDSRAANRFTVGFNVGIR